MTVRVRVALSLTARQAKMLAMTACGGGLAETDPYARAEWTLLAKALNDIHDVAAAEDAARAARSYPCEACGRVVAHSTRGDRPPSMHTCPHGRTCLSKFNRLFGCTRCRDARAGSTVE
jgi:hypothetical protein